jgi:hypothetical protein
MSACSGTAGLIKSLVGADVKIDGVVVGWVHTEIVLSVFECRG